MEKEVVKDIKELIEYLLNIRERTLIENEENARLVNSFSIEDTYNQSEEEKIINNKFDKRLITLNSLLEKEEQNQSVLEIETIMKEMNKKLDSLSHNKTNKKELTAEEIKAIHEKEFINIEEFQIIFKRGKESQKKYRGRHKNPLPTFSSGGSGVDTIYNRLEAQKWMKRYL